MAKIIRRECTSRGPLGKRARHVAFGYTLAHLSQSHLWTAVESLSGLTPDLRELDRMTHKRSHSDEQA